MANTDLWSPLVADLQPTPLSGTAWHVTCAGAEQARLALSDSLTRLQRLDQLLTAGDDALKHRLHPLLAKPWQQRGWPRGSRFQSPRQSSGLYASLELETALAEVAAQRARFWLALPAAARSAPLRASHTAFSFSYHCPAGARLQNPPFKAHRQLLTQADSRPARALAQQLRRQGFTGWEYPSDCCPHFGLNLLLLAPDHLGSTRPAEQQLWLSEVDDNGVTLLSNQRRLRFGLHELLDDTA